jgi:hypothetical protein
MLTKIFITWNQNLPILQHVCQISIAWWAFWHTWCLLNISSEILYTGSMGWKIFCVLGVWAERYFIYWEYGLKDILYTGSTGWKIFYILGVWAKRYFVYWEYGLKDISYTGSMGWKIFCIRGVWAERYFI